MVHENHDLVANVRKQLLSKNKACGYHKQTVRFVVQRVHVQNIVDVTYKNYSAK